PPGRELYLKANPYSLAASRVTFGFNNICVSGLAINPDTVTTGQVKTRVCLRVNSPTTSHHRSNFFSNCPLPCKKPYSPLANRSAASGAFTAPALEGLRLLTSRRSVSLSSLKPGSELYDA